MEYAIPMIFVLILVWFLCGMLKSKGEKGSGRSKSDITKIDDKNWIVKGEIVSFEEDTPLLRFQQEREDNKHYQEYERARLQYDRDKIYEEWNRTTQFIRKYPNGLGVAKPPAAKDMQNIIEKYQRYLKMCKKLKEDTFVLTEKEFIIKEKNFIHCGCLKLMTMVGVSGIYTIHNEKTAKYIGGNVMEKIKKEFEEKWY